jgi:hypothetical protein
MLLSTTATATPPPNQKDLTQGTWDLQLAKSKFSCTPAPQKSSREIVDVGWGLIVTHWTGADSKGQPTDFRYVYRYDGTKYPSEIEKPADEAIVWKLVNPRRVEFTHYSKDDKITQELSRIVTADGKTMTQVTKYIGKPCGEDVQVFERR